jgi:hypothetical protein
MKQDDLASRVVETDPPGTNDPTSLIQVGDVVRNRATGLLGRVETVTLRMRETGKGPEANRVFFVALEPGQHAVWRDGEIDA